MGHPTQQVVDAFAALPLIGTYVDLDLAEGCLYRYEVRKDPTTGLTLRKKFRTTDTETTSK